MESQVKRVADALERIAAVFERAWAFAEKCIEEDRAET